MEKPRQSWAGLWNISFGFFGIQIGFVLQGKMPGPCRPVFRAVFLTGIGNRLKILRPTIPARIHLFKIFNPVKPFYHPFLNSAMCYVFGVMPVHTGWLTERYFTQSIDVIT